MTQGGGISQQDILDRVGTLIVLRPVAGSNAVDLFLVVADDGRVTGFCGHVDLGTGIATALAQIVAEELDVPVGQVSMVLGHTGLAPNQGATIASETIQVAAIPLRRAAAQARHFLLNLAAEMLGCDAGDLSIDAGRIGGNATSPVDFAALLKGRRDRLVLSDDAAVKQVADYRVVGRAVQRVDIPAKAAGVFTYVHDVRVPGMLHGRVVRPPYAGLDAGECVGTSLISVDEQSIADVAGVVALVVIRDFVGIVAVREEQAVDAANRLRIAWKPGPRLPDLHAPADALCAQPGRPRTLLDTGGVDEALAHTSRRLTRRYVWPYQMHASIGPSCAVADYRADGVTVWSGTQNPHVLQADLALLLGVPASSIDIIREEAAGCYGRNCADDVAADAALLSRHVGRPVRVQLSREQEHLWEPKGAAQVMDVDGGLAQDNAVAAYDFATRYPSNAAPTLALLLTGVVEPVAAVSQMGDRTAVPPYRFAPMRITVHDIAPIVRASWLRGVSALPNSFAHECYIDELATEARADPVAFRLQHLGDRRAAELIADVAARAGWESRDGPRRQIIRQDVARGQGFAYARYVHGPFPGTAASWSAWVAEVEVDTRTGEVAVTRVVVGQDSGLVINPEGLKHQIHGNVIQSVSRTLKEEVRFSDTAVASREWGGYPILTFPEVPVIQVVMVARPEEPPLGAGESASVPSAAAIANAIFDATGVRLREPPFTPARVKEALRHAAGEPPDKLSWAQRVLFHLTKSSLRASKRSVGAPGAVARVGAVAAVLGGIAGFAVSFVPFRVAMPEVAAPDPHLYSAEAVARGRALAAIGNCAVCHTQEGGALNAGGRALHTPFGTVYSTNLTPDPATGLGGWSYAAFARAMRSGVHRDGRHLYPAFPYTAYARVTDNDLQALYAYLMVQAPVVAAPPRTRLTFPFNLRPLLAAWNAMFHRAAEFRPDPARDAVWNRGAYLVQGLGHCSACHAPRNLLGAETQARPFASGFAEGWEAPPLTVPSYAPVAWTEDDIFDYLRNGFSPLHGVAGGPMAAVVASLAEAPAEDIRAMAHYLASFQAPVTQAEAQGQADRLVRAASAPGPAGEGAQLYEGACAACHEAGTGFMFGVRPLLAVNTNLQSSRPDNLLRIILDGAGGHGQRSGAMPPFRDSLDDRQLSSLLTYLRARFGGGKPEWSGIERAAARSRAEPAFR
jgi:nicotinate dehydrogenase subunit B